VGLLQQEIAVGVEVSLPQRDIAVGAKVGTPQRGIAIGVKVSLLQAWHCFRCQSWHSTAGHFYR